MRHFDKHRRARRNWRHRRPRSKRFSGFSWRLKRVLKSLKFWLPIFFIIYFVTLFLEAPSPTAFYVSVPLAVRIILYSFAFYVALLTGYRIFRKLDYEPKTDAGIYGLMLLSGGIFIASLLFLMFGISTIFAAALLFKHSLSAELLTAYSVTLSATLLLLSGYLSFKFMRRAGTIIFVRRW